ncbi:MAG: Gfo/Idh/MocA family oxidoreductase [Fimbriimonadaceae bacterium]|nr:Gfo/Idh/MocA family oxidoreductase [Fimbriimonadaceae bacterium]
MDALRVGIIGVGNISGIYIKNLTAYPETEVIAVADLDAARAASVAQQHGIPHALTPDALIAHPDVDLVLNLTIPAAHGDIARRALTAGKHVYNEKPLTISLDEARELVALADTNGRYLGCAPDTYLGGGHQTARKAIDDGLIGAPIGASAAFMAHGPEAWHPNPDFFYRTGGGPMLDMGPYYVTALVHLLGPVRRLSGSARISQATRPVPRSNEQYYARPDRAEFAATGYEMPVETPTHYVGVLEFANGAIGDLCTSFDIWHHRHDWSNPITIYGTEGTLLVPDPNFFGGSVKVKRHDDSEWRELPNPFSFNENSRGLGILDLAYALHQGRSPRVTGTLALHALEVMMGIPEADATGTYIRPATQPERPAPMQRGEFNDPNAGPNGS